MKIHRVLIAPLDWGLGHATRCVPIIDELLSKGVEVIVAASGESAELLKKEFPQLRHLSLNGYNIRYSKCLTSWLAVLLQVPKIIFQILKERQWLKRIIEKEDISVVISDNRFGLWNKKVTSVYMTHQVMIKCPRGFKFFEPLLYRFHSFFIKRYSRCWIPDFPSKEKNLSGDLSHKYKLPPNTQYIGPLSRLNETMQTKSLYDIVAVVSGSEPQRTLFEKIISESLLRFPSNSIIIQGIPSQKKNSQSSMTTFIPHLPANDLEEVLSSAKLIICRAGYSSIMDLVRLKKNAVLVPTPGQTEQEYLADSLTKKGVFFSMHQDKFNLADAIEQSKKFSVENFRWEKNESLLNKAVGELMDYRQVLQV